MQPDGPGGSGGISFEVYNAVIDQLTPVDVRLVDLSFNIKNLVHSGPLLSSAEMSIPVPVGKPIPGSSGELYVDIEHKATFKISATDGSLAGEGRATFHVRLRLGFEPPNEFWPIFLQRNIKLYTHPALRDLLSSLSTRAGVISLPLGSVAVTQAVSKTSTPLPAQSAKSIPASVPQDQSQS